MNIVDQICENLIRKIEPLVTQIVVKVLFLHKAVEIAHQNVENQDVEMFEQDPTPFPADPDHRHGQNNDQHIPADQPSDQRVLFRHTAQSHISVDQPDLNEQTDQHIPAGQPLHKRFYCAQCGEICFSAKILKKHYAIAHSEKYFCHRCDKVFVHTSSYRRHYYSVHFSGLPYKCRFCSSQFRGIRERTRHMTEVHFEECLNCGLF